MSIGIRQFAWTLCAACAVSATAQGQFDRTRDERLEAYNRRISGRESPDLIPEYEKISAFLSYRGAPDLRLPDADARRLDEFAAAERELRSTDYSTNLNQTVCNGVVGADLNQIDATSIAIEIDEIARRGEQRAVDRFMRLVTELTPEGRDTVEAFIEDRVLPNLTILKVDYVGRAAEFPELHARQYKSMCEGTAPPRFEGLSPEARDGDLFSPNTRQP